MTFVQTLKFNKEPKTDIKGLFDIKLSVIDKPNPDYKLLVYQKVKATWLDEPVKITTLRQLNDLKEEINSVFMDVISFKTLPNSMEAINFTFLIENIPLIEITHLLRHRTLSGIHAQCTGDRDLRDDPMYIPNSISKNEKFSSRYIALIKDAVKLYSDMVDSKEISLMDARYVLPRASMYFYYFTMNLKDIILFINQRKCTMIQPEVDNYIAIQMYDIVCSVIPEMRSVLKISCDTSCHYIKSNDNLNTRLYNADSTHKELFEKLNKSEPVSVYNKTRLEMGGAI